MSIDTLCCKRGNLEKSKRRIASFAMMKEVILLLKLQKGKAA
jgi:hypothetical protein